MQCALGYAVSKWNEASRDPSVLLRGTSLSHYENWAAETDLGLTVEERVTTGADVGRIIIWEAKTGRELLKLVGQSALISYLDFSFDRKFLASTSEDRTLIIWDTSSGEPLQVYTTPRNAFSNVVFTPDGKSYRIHCNWSCLRLYFRLTGVDPPG